MKKRPYKFGDKIVVDDDSSAEPYAAQILSTWAEGLSIADGGPMPIEIEWRQVVGHAKEDQSNCNV